MRYTSTITVLFLSFALLCFNLSCVAQTPASDTLDLVNWNLEYFGDDENQLPEEMTKTGTIMNKLNADIYALEEIVNKDSLASLVASLKGNYGFILSSFGSFAQNEHDPGWAEAQKLAFVYRKSMVRNVIGRPFLLNSAAAYYNWSSGRYPFLVNAEILGRDQFWHPLHFIITHAKAGSDNNSCDRRYYGATELKDSLDLYFSDKRFVILGDFNDDLDQTICGNYPASNYAGIVADSVDMSSYHSVTLPLSKQGVSSISGFPSFLDHVVVSNELYPCYVPGSAEMLEDKVNGWVSGYNQYVSDHFPVRSRYVIVAPESASELVYPLVEISPNPATTTLQIRSRQKVIEYCLTDIGGRIKTKVRGPGDCVTISLDGLPSGLYSLHITFDDGELLQKKITIIK